MIAEWDQPAQLITPAGTLLLNQQHTDGYWYQLVPRQCSSGLPVRATRDDIPQGDGQINHKRWRGGYVAHLAISLWERVGDGAQPACDTVLRQMVDELGLYVNALVNPRTGARYEWSPSGYSDDRMIDQAQLLNVQHPVHDDSTGATVVEIDIDSPFPYYIDATQQTQQWTAGETHTIVNAGNSDFMPVFNIFGAATDFVITNNSALDDDGEPLGLTYDSSLPGAAAIAGGDYIFFDFFRNVAYRNGNLNNRKPGIDIRVSDFFPLVPGNNEIEITGADGELLWNNAWA